MTPLALAIGIDVAVEVSLAAVEERIADLRADAVALGSAAMPEHRQLSTLMLQACDLLDDQAGEIRARLAELNSLTATEVRA